MNATADLPVVSLHSTTSQQSLTTVRQLDMARLKVSLASDSRRSLAGMAATIVALHTIGWGILVWVATLSRGSTGAVFGLGLGVTVYALGLRHAFDADHIAAIDNTTRKLVQDGRRPLSVGFWFSLGHSSVVFVVCLLLAFGVRSLASHLGDGTRLTTLFSTFGLAVSAVFLIVLGVVNLGSFTATMSQVRRSRQGQPIDAEDLSTKGVLTRLISRRLRAISKPRHIYPVGVMFGLGFDTATEVALLALTGGAAAMALPWPAILALPLIFAAGMSLLDTADGVMMNHVYSWASVQPTRKLYYNLVVTGVSIVFALGIGFVEVAALLSGVLHIESGPLAWLGETDLKWVGFILFGIFAVAAAAVWLRSRNR